MSELWNTQFLNHPIFAPLAYQFGEKLNSFTQWPSLQAYQQFGLAPVQFVAQNFKPQCISEQYESRIFLKREVLTRQQNWHDLFNTLSWHQFAQSKLTMNQLQVQAISQRQMESQSQRSQLENWITQWDECGIIVISRRYMWLELLTEHAWADVFYKARHEMMDEMSFIIYGHGLYENALEPFIGLTGKGLLLYWPDWQPQNVFDQLSVIDQYLAKYIMNPLNALRVKKLQPIPILGIPEWDCRNHQASFYANEDYFRPRRTEVAPIIDVSKFDV